jgi:hypothetical protein
MGQGKPCGQSSSPGLAALSSMPRPCDMQTTKPTGRHFTCGIEGRQLSLMASFCAGWMKAGSCQIDTPVCPAAPYVSIFQGVPEYTVKGVHVICRHHWVQRVALGGVQGSNVCRCSHVQQCDVWGPTRRARHDSHVGWLDIKVQLQGTHTHTWIGGRGCCQCHTPYSTGYQLPWAVQTPSPVGSLMKPHHVTLLTVHADGPTASQQQCAGMLCTLCMVHVAQYPQNVAQNAQTHAVASLLTLHKDASSAAVHLHAGTLPKHEAQSLHALLHDSPRAAS